MSHVNGIKKFADASPSRLFTTMKTFKKLTSKVTRHDNINPRGSQSTAPSHIPDGNPDKVLSALMFDVGMTEKVLGDLRSPVLNAAVGDLLAVLKSIKVCSSCMLPPFVYNVTVQ